MPLYLDEIQVVGIKSEAAQNTAPTFTGTDYFLAEGFEVKPVPSLLPRNYKRATLDTIASVLGNVVVDVKGKIELKGSGTAGTPWGPLDATLQACGISSTAVATHSIKSISVDTQGSGYTSAPTVVITPQIGDTGTGAAAIAVIANGKVVSIFVTNPGSLYLVAPDITFTGGGGTLAAATASLGATVLYQPISAPASSDFFTVGKSVTIEIYKGAKTAAKKHVIKGCVVTAAKLVNSAGQFGALEVSFRGLYTSIGEADLPSTTYNNTIPPILQSSAFNAFSYSPVSQKFELDLGIKYAMREDMNSAYGVLGFQLTGRVPAADFNPEVSAQATHDPFATMLNITEGSAAFNLGSVAGNMLTIAMPKLQIIDIGYESRGGNLVYGIKAKVNADQGDDWLSIVSR